MVYPDHTTSTNSGSFAFLNIDVGSLGDRGRLMSHKYKPAGPECLQFWYLFVGNDIGTLNILKFSNNTYSNPFWTKKDISEDEWQYGQVEIGDSRNDFSFVFEGIKSSGNAGVLGIDDVMLRIGACPAPINCNFEDATICSWSQYKYDDMDWLLIQGQKGIIIELNNLDEILKLNPFFF